MIDTILFDVDGTILNTEQVMLESLQKALVEVLNISVTKKDLSFILSLTTDITLASFTDSNETKQKLRDRWTFYRGKMIHRIKSFDGIDQLIAGLKREGFLLGIVTSRNAQEYKDGLNHLELKNFFDVVITSSDTEKHKPNPDPILKALELLGTPAERAVYIGDSVGDMKSAQSSGTRFMLAGWGAKEHEEFRNVKTRLEVPADLKKILSGKNVSLT